MPITASNGESTQNGTFANMKPDALYILLYRDHDEDIRFHWGLYHFLNPTEGGWKFDIIRPDGHWTPSVPYKTTASTNTIDDTYGDGPLACAVRIAYIDRSAWQQVHSLITREDGELGELNGKLDGKLNCRVFVQRACLRLPLPSFVDPSSWEDLQLEVLELGERCRDDAGKRPVVVVDSRMAIMTGSESESESE